MVSIRSLVRDTLSGGSKSKSPAETKENVVAPEAPVASATGLSQDVKAQSGEIIPDESTPPPYVAETDRSLNGATATHPPAVSHPPPPHGQQMANQLGQTGMGLGMADSMINPNGPDMGTGIVDGMVGGRIIGQRIDQARSHAFWKQRQQDYLAGDETAVVNNGVPMSDREAKRAERRQKRWDRRA
jgi:hypothetical protein